ncbi:DUF2968 domain-containing protein [Trinickia caryophylli]|uniref:DUF2968 domain-containing protein n=1 Tax=Trinickia caryophylli TaxID=28094 RepID=A0A1X7FPN6_TRICW|nr:DUF2968 domain-containing protein [Trinickia caryophylli]PMS13883.1 DUF2968 domain-containing protein [Trinickia caryophylli]TRX14380.1 DUF2968 domain-containing protein [Trinickia caryophylli]WQE14217.1 DUF2968 domain-containing protein [Trinickia caryophylli]SMF55686.1 Protein of unknown function [Trinickia caryophylli]GLU33276.1 hypothetical protein Busp01_31180 [Trinickia caryophylli]
MSIPSETVTEFTGKATSDIDATRHRTEGSAAGGELPPATVVALHDVPATSHHGSQRASKPADIEEVADRILANALTPVQVFSSFEYEINLLFEPASLGFYVVLSHAGTIRRALQCAALEGACQAFRHFQEQILVWCELELRRVQIDARNAQLAALFNDAVAEAERLRADIERSGALVHLVNSRQQVLRREVAQLQAQRISTQAQLDRQLRQLAQLRLCAAGGIPRNLR